MNRGYFIRLFDYNFWAHRQIWEPLSTLGDEDYTRDLGVGSLFDQCFHILSYEAWWFHYLKDGEGLVLDQDSLADRAAIHQQCLETESYARSYVYSLTPKELRRDVKHPDWKEPLSVWEVLLHLANHSTDHRAQILGGLRQLGLQTVPDLDFVKYVECKSQPVAVVTSVL